MRSISWAEAGAAKTVSEVQASAASAKRRALVMT
jgi:hypothetical protein